MATRMVFFPALLLLAAAPLCGKPAPNDAARSASTAPARPRAQLEKRIYTNDLLDEMMGRRAAPEAPAVALTEASAVEAPPEASPISPMAKLKPYVRENDPAWYSRQLDAWRAELNRIDAQMTWLRDFRASGRGMMSGLVLGEPNLRLTPENELEQLNLERREVTRQIDDLEELARRMGILPGVLRGDLVPSPAVLTPSRPSLKPSEIEELEDERTRLEIELIEQQMQLVLAKNDLELSARDELLVRQQFYSNPSYTTDSVGRARLEALGSQLGATREEIRTRQERIAALQEDLETLNRALGPRFELRTAEEERALWQQRLEPVRNELVQVEAELARMRAEATTRSMSLYLQTSTGSPTAMLLWRLENRANGLRQLLASMDEEARRAGVPPGWLR